MNEEECCACRIRTSAGGKKYGKRYEEVLLMSVENLKKFGQMCAEDEKVRARAKEIGLQDIDRQISYAKSLGLEFSREDFEALAKEAVIDEKNELSDEELEGVAGGYERKMPTAAIKIIRSWWF
jgi:predicted ribosomally synthesized peptide with nif11-like leader